MSVCSGDVQSNRGGLVESDSDFALMLWSFPGAEVTFVPFCFEEPDENDGEDGPVRVEPMVETLVSQLREATPEDLDFHVHWMTFFFRKRRL